MPNQEVTMSPERKEGTQHRFAIGETCSLKPMKDCFGIQHPAVHGLTVFEVKTIPASHGLAEYRRIAAYVPGSEPGGRYYEGAERFFELES